MVLVSTGRSLVLQEWDDLYIVYQSSSAETHVFNETTALILKGLEHGPVARAVLKEWTETALGIEPGEIAADDFTLAAQRLEELGLIECLDEISAVQ